jgi:hypothetical protein
VPARYAGSGMKRRLFNLAAAVSLGMMLASVAMWMWTYRIGRAIDFNGDYTVDGMHDALHVGAHRGWLKLTRLADLGSEYPQAARTIHLESYWSDATTAASAAHVGVFYLDSRHLVTGWWSVGVQFWLLAILTGVFPLFWFVRYWRNRTRLSGGRCAHCGYDLRATPERCPECGTAAAAGEARRA